jgi:hypothetical protein
MGHQDWQITTPAIQATTLPIHCESIFLEEVILQAEQNYKRRLGHTVGRPCYCRHQRPFARVFHVLALVRFFGL